MSIIHQPKKRGIVVPFHIIKEQMDQHLREDWDDPNRYERQVANALKYIPVRAKSLPNKDKLLREVKRVFHDDLITDTRIIEAVEREVYRNTEVEPAVLAAPETPVAEKRVVRGVDDSDATLESLERQLKEELTEP